MLKSIWLTCWLKGFSPQYELLDKSRNFGSKSRSTRGTLCHSLPKVGQSNKELDFGSSNTTNYRNLKRFWTVCCGSAQSINGSATRKMVVIQNQDLTLHSMLCGHLFEFLTIFEFTATPPAFLSFMNVILSGIVWSSCCAYLNTICIFAPSFEQHLVHLQ